MFSTTNKLYTSDIQAAHIHAIATDSTDAELAELRMLTRAGEMHPRDAAPLIADLEQRIVRRDARDVTLGRAGTGLASTLDLETWHGDNRDRESAALRLDLQADGLL
jgi:hypothetical protein